MKNKSFKFTVILSADDHYKLVYKSKEMNLSQANLIRELIRKSLIDDIKELNLFVDDLRKLTRSLSNNLNQISKKVNSKILLDEIDEAEKLNEEITKIWQLLKS
ncbi:plasmid mobilization relaxosome protein MobC [uncultured Fusobacterium sp.]|uniref:plasmid mobilization relaxosome protein MobC n=1 Tax=uncultured Fusobacterium sp. TaxID=159267 RepID=UPI0025988EEB|nr:plasmid mobilization relaxosome protein MobC [uncultured Fusobacterium sp.]